MAQHQKTLTVPHAGNHAATEEQVNAALDAALKDDGVKRSKASPVQFTVAEVTSGDSSKIVVHYDVDEAKESKAEAKTGAATKAVPPPEKL